MGKERPTTASLTLDLAAKMLASRVGVAATRSAAKPFMAQNLPKLALAARVPATQYRPIATVKQTPAEGNEILAKQRLNPRLAPSRHLQDEPDLAWQLRVDAHHRLR